MVINATEKNRGREMRSLCVLEEGGSEKTLANDRGSIVGKSSER